VDELITRWLGSHEEQLSLFEGDDEIILRRQFGSFQLNVQLTPHCPAQFPLETWMRLGEVSLNHFQGALAQASVTGALWLAQCIPDKHQTHLLLNTIEQLLNQRDTWRAVVARQVKQHLKRPPSPLRSLAL
jgi:hypothetical protein